MSIITKNKGMAAIILLLIIALVMSPIVSMAGNGDSGEFNPIGPHYQVEPGKDVQATETINVKKTDERTLGDSGEKLFVEHSKTITKAGIDRYKISLDVKTNQVRENTKEEILKPVDVVVVLDVSGSMVWDMDGNKNNIATPDQRITKAKEAINSFIDSYMTTGGINSFSLVKFSDSGRKVKTDGDNYWTNDPTKAKAAVKGVTADGSTNIKDGLVKGKELLATAPNENSQKVVILVSDGEANAGGDWVSTGWFDGYYDHIGAAKKQIDSIKADYSDSQLFTIGIKTNAAMSEVLTYKHPTTNIGVDGFYNVSESTNISLEDAFEAIDNIINHLVQVWTVTDPMGDHMDFGGFGAGDITNADGTISNSSGTATYSAINGAFEWKLGAAQPTFDNGKTYYNYHLEYFISVNTSAEDFPYGEYIPTNGETVLKYDFNNDRVETDPWKTSYFTVPSVAAQDTRARADVTIAKTVTGTTDRSQEFDFTVLVNNQAYANGAYTVGGDAKTADANGIIKLKGGQTATIEDVVVGSIITVTESDAPNYTVQGDKVKIQTVGELGASFAFTNAYDTPTSIAGIKTSTLNAPVWRTDTIPYDIEIKNNDDTTATGIIVKDYIPAKTIFKSSATGTYGEDATGKYVAWYIDSIDPGKSAKVSFDVTVDGTFTQSDEVVNQGLFEVTGEEKPDSFNGVTPTGKTGLVTHYPVASAMSIDKFNYPDQGEPGDGEYVDPEEEITYVLSVNNDGRPDLNAVVRDYIPAGTSYVDGSASDGGSYNSEAGYVEWTLTGIPSGEFKEVSFKVIVDEDAVLDQEIRNTAIGVVKGDGEIPDDDSWETRSNEVYNLVAEVEGELIKPEDKEKEKGEVKGKFETPASTKGAEAKTSDEAATSLPSLVIMLIASLAVMIAFLTRLTRREE